MKKIWVFVDDSVVATPGHFDQWAAFAESETEAALKIQARYGLGGVRLKLTGVFEDRRGHADRRRDSDAV